MAQVSAGDYARNEPCPCGSGLKYKKCCLPKGGPPAPGSKRRRTILAIVAAAAVPLGLVVGIVAGWKLGFVTGAGWIVAVGVYASIRNPPPPNPGADDPAALNFGG